MSPLQYWVYRFKRLPTSVHLLLNIVFCFIILFSLVKPATFVQEWYPGGVKIQPTIHIVVPTRAPVPTSLPVPTYPPVVAAPPVVQEQPVVVEQPASVEQVVPTVAPPATSMPQPTPNKEATVQAWLASPPSTPTTVSDFVASFQPQPECNPFIGYVGMKRYTCDVFPTQTAEAGR